MRVSFDESNNQQRHRGERRTDRGRLKLTTSLSLHAPLSVRSPSAEPLTADEGCVRNEEEGLCTQSATLTSCALLLSPLLLFVIHSTTTATVNAILTHVRSSPSLVSFYCSPMNNSTCCCNLPPSGCSQYLMDWSISGS